MERFGLRWQRFRAALSFLSDLGGALALVLAAVALFAGAVAGVFFVAIDVVPQPYFTMFMLAAAFGSAGLALHLLRDRLAAPVAPGLPRQQSDPQVGQAENDLRRALRLIRQELLDDRFVIQRYLDSEFRKFPQLRFNAWAVCEETLVTNPDSEPYNVASEAYREMRALHDGQWTRAEGDLGLHRRVVDPPPTTDVQIAIEKIDAAVEGLAAADKGGNES